MEIDNYINLEWVEDQDLTKYSGIHTCTIMKNLFTVEQVTHVVEGSYQGEVGAVWEFPNGQYGVVTDYFGSCTVCDQGLAITDKDDLERLMKTFSHNTHLEDSIDDIIEYLKVDDGEHYRYTDVREPLINKLEGEDNED